MVMAIAGGVAGSGCAQWQYPWRTFSVADEKPAAANQGDPLIPPATVKDLADGSDSEGNGERTPRQMNDMLARLQGAAGSQNDENAAPAPALASRPTSEPQAIKRRNKPTGEAARATPKSPVAGASKKPSSKPQSTGQARPVVLNVSVSSAAPQSLASDGSSSGTPSTAQANQALRTTPPTQGGNGSSAVARQIQSEASKDPDSVKSKWQMSLLKLAAGEQAPVDEGDPAAPRSERAQLLNQAVEATAATGTLLTDPMAAHEDALDAVEKLRDALRNEAGLRIAVVMLCSRVDAFGVYEELPESALMPNRSNQAIVYCEIENFTSEPFRDGFRSLLASRLELFTREGDSVWVDEHEDIEDFCRRRRDDFFVAQLVTFPRGLPAGDYVLKVTITDRLASKTNQATKPLTIGRPQGMVDAR